MIYDTFFLLMATFRLWRRFCFLIPWRVLGVLRSDIQHPREMPSRQGDSVRGSFCLHIGKPLVGEIENVALSPGRI